MLHYKYFRGKDYLIADNWTDVWQKQHARAFTVAKAAKLSVLREIRIGLDKALADGITEREFIKTLKPRLKKMGWWGKDEFKRQLGSTRRLKTIFRTNMASSYNAGRYREQKRRAELKIGARPYWQYIAVLDQRTRDQHRALNGKVFRHDDPFWDYFYPPNGYNCRCRVSDLSARDVEKGKLRVEKIKGDLPTIEKKIKRIDYRTGEVQYRNVDVHLYRGRNAAGRKFAVTPHPGFDYNPGKQWPAWDPLGSNPDRIPGKWTPNPKFRQKNWKDIGLRAAKEEKWDAPDIPKMKAAADAAAAKEQLATQLPIGEKATPVGNIMIQDESLAHIAGKREHARERYARHFRMTLEDPDEVWLAFYHRQKEYRRRFLKVFTTENEAKRLVVIARENADGGIVITAFEAARWQDIDKLREGALLYKKSRPA